MKKKLGAIWISVPILFIACGGDPQSSPVGKTSEALASDPNLLALEYQTAAPRYGNVAFGANGSFLYRTMAGPFTCDRATFGGDPAIGVIKACYKAPSFGEAQLSTQFVGDYPSSGFNWSDEVQGLAHSADSWFIAQQTTLWKMPLTSDLNSDGAPPGSISLSFGQWQEGNQAYTVDLQGYDHFGDHDFHAFSVASNGARALFVPVQDTSKKKQPVISIFNGDDLSYVTSTPFPTVTGVDLSPAAGTGSVVAVRPGPTPSAPVTLWVSGTSTADKSPVFVAFAFDTGHAIVNPDGTWVYGVINEEIPEVQPPLSLLTMTNVYRILDATGTTQVVDMQDTMQGIAFNEDGTLLYSSTGYCDTLGRLHAFDIVEGGPSGAYVRLRDESYNPTGWRPDTSTNDRSYVFETEPEDKLCPSDTSILGGIFGTIVNLSGLGTVGAIAGYLIGEDVAPNCVCNEGSQEPEGLDYFDTRGLNLPNIPDSQVHVLLSRNGHLLPQNTVWLKHYNFPYTVAGLPPDQNLAVGKPSYQSSTILGATANLANDGNIDGNFFDGSVSHTDYGLTGWSSPDSPGQYWYVDLGAVYTIDQLNIYQRTDCCTDRLSHYNVLAYDPNLGWYVVSNHSQDVTTYEDEITVSLNGIQTEYVMIAKTDPNYLHLAEVQVFGY